MPSSASESPRLSFDPGPFSLEQCREWFADQGITRFKTPELVIALDSIPTLAAGKPDRAALKKMAERVSRGNG